jgi:hypothetical protein
MSSFLVAVGALFILAGAGTAGAQSKCDAGKLKEYGKKVFCLAKLDAKAAKKGIIVDSAAYSVAGRRSITAMQITNSPI